MNAARCASRCIYSSRVGRTFIGDRRPRTSDHVDTGNHHRIFPARRDTLPAVADFIAAVCMAGGVPRKACLRMTLLVEELFTNTVVHGHGRDTEAPIHVTFAVGVDVIALTYEDTAPAHDPFAKIGVPDEAAGVEERPVGGLGVMLIVAMADRVQYAHIGGRNRISLIMPTGRTSP